MRLHHDPRAVEVRRRLSLSVRDPHLISLGHDGPPKLRHVFRRYGVGQLVRTAPRRAPYLHRRGRCEATLCGGRIWRMTGRENTATARRSEAAVGRRGSSPPSPPSYSETCWAGGKFPHNARDILHTPYSMTSTGRRIVVVGTTQPPAIPVAHSNHPGANRSQVSPPVSTHLVTCPPLSGFVER